jgi:hypothetical protein
MDPAPFPRAQRDAFAREPSLTGIALSGFSEIRCSSS